MIQVFTTQSRLLTTLSKKLIENIVGNGVILCPAFSPFPTMFSTHQREKSSLKPHLFCHLQMLSIWFSPKFCCLVKSSYMHKKAPVHAIPFKPEKF